jgi:hypothetical protein
LGHKTVEVSVGGSLDIEVASAHIIEGLVIETEGAIGVLKERVGGEDMVVGLHDGSGHLRGRSHGERQLRLAAVVHRESLEKEGAKTRSSSSTSGVEDHEALETSAVISKLADSIKDQVNNLFANGVVTTGVVISGIFLSRDNLLGVVQLAVGASADLVTNTGLQVDQHGTRNVLASTSLREKSVEGVISATDSLVGGHLAVGLNSVLQAIKLPASISGLDSSLTNVNRKALTHFVLLLFRLVEERW